MPRATTSARIPINDPGRQGQLVLLPVRRPSRSQKPTGRTRGRDLPGRHRAEDTHRPEPAPDLEGRCPQRGQQIPPRTPQRTGHHQIHASAMGDLQQEHPRRLQPRPQPAQPSPHRGRRHPQPLSDRTVTGTLPASGHRSTDHLDPIRPAQQDRHRQQHVRDQTPRAPRPPRSQYPGHTVHPAGPRPPPRPQQPPTPRTRQLPVHEPGLDQNRISLYRHQRCLRASARPSRDGPPRHDTREGRGRLRRRDCAQARPTDDADHEHGHHNEHQPVVGKITDGHRHGRQRKE